MTRVLLVSLWLIVSSAANGNDTAVRGVGGTIQAMDAHPTVRLVREKVHARLTWEGAKVRCEFVFRNEGPATTVKMGFPEESSGGVEPMKESSFKGFRSYVDGRLASTSFILSKPREEEFDYRGWHVKSVPFAANQERKVVNEYTAPLGEDSMGGRFFTYILTTGSSWKGNVGEAEIIVDVAGISSLYYVTRAEPGSYQRRGYTFTWRIKDFEPRENIRIDFRPRRTVRIGPPPGGAMRIYDERAFSETGVAMVFLSHVTGLPGVTLSWDQVKRQSVIQYADHSLVLVPGSKTAVLDGSKHIVLPRAPYINSSGQMIGPIIAVAKVLGLSVSYDSKSGATLILAAGQ
jgi:hypothetical protein